MQHWMRGTQIKLITLRGKKAKEKRQKQRFKVNYQEKSFYLSDAMYVIAGVKYELASRQRLSGGFSRNIYLILSLNCLKFMVL